jgi:hypothetical protein
VRSALQFHTQKSAILNQIAKNWLFGLRVFLNCDLKNVETQRFQIIGKRGIFLKMHNF